MAEQFSSFVREALEFLSLLRASEKERFETEKKFMKETTKVLKELAESINKNNTLVKNTLEDLKRTVTIEIKKVEEKIGLNNLTEAIGALEKSVDLLQRGSTILDYKFTIQKTREMIDELKKSSSQIRASSNPAPATSRPQAVTSGAPAAQKTAANPSTKEPPPPKPQMQASDAPKPPKTKTTRPPPKPQAETKAESPPPAQAGSSLAAAMGTRPSRTRPARRVVKLDKAPTTKIVDSKGGPIEIETGSDEDD
jgi:hypothetical protein